MIKNTHGQMDQDLYIRDLEAEIERLETENKWLREKLHFYDKQRGTTLR